MQSKQLTIDPEFEAIGRKLTAEEDSLLEASLRVSGCIDPIITWANHDDTILDGHNRYRKCHELGIKFATHPLVLETRQAVREWIIDHQLGKRNLTDEEKSYYRGLRYLEERKPEGKKKKIPAQNEHVSGTASRLATQYDVSPATIRRDAKFAESVNAIADVAPDIKQEILSGTSGLTSKAIVEAAAVPSPERAAAVAKAKAAVHVGKNTGMPEWYTPDEYLDAARLVLGEIDLDPASSAIAQKRVKAKRFYSVADDGLTKKWKGNIWLNPPYTAGLVDRFLDKLLIHHAAGDVPAAIVLVNNATDTKWFQDAADVSSAICFSRGRIRFLDPDGKPGAPLQGQAVLYFGKAVSRFTKAFRQFGFVAEVSHG